MKISDKALAAMMQKRVTELEGNVRELIAHAKLLEKRIAILEKGAK